MTFDTLPVIQETSKEKQFRKTLMASPCPRCLIDQKLKESLDEFELVMYTKFKSRPHRCILSGPKMETLKLQAMYSF